MFTPVPSTEAPEDRREEKNDWHDKFGKLKATALAYLWTLWLSITNPAQLRVHSRNTLGPLTFVSISIAILTATTSMLWSDNPIGQYEVPAVIRPIFSLLKYIPLGTTILFLSYIAITTLPVYVVLRLLGAAAPFRSHLDLSCYLFGAIWVLFVAALLMPAIFGTSYYQRSIAPWIIWPIAIYLSIRQIQEVAWLCHIGKGKVFVAYLVPMILILPIEIIGNYVPNVGHLGRSFYIPSGSMIPTLEVGGVVFANMSVYKWRDIKRGEVIVFTRSFEPETVWVRRVVGLPGDRVQYKGGVLFLNGEQVVRKKTSPYLYRAYGSKPILVEQYEEELEDLRYRIMEIDNDGPVDNTPEFTVPDGKLFVLGDNRDNSQDSRTEVYGERFIDKTNVLGKIYFRSHPMTKNKIDPSD